MKMISTKFKLLYCLIILIAAILLFSKTTYAADEDLLINEVYPNPTGISTDNFEWVEIYNRDGTILNLSAYSIVKITTSGNEYQFNGGILSDSVCTTIDNFYYVCNLGNGWLSNSSTKLSLRTSFDQAEIDSVTYGDTTNYPQNAKAPPSGKSITRLADAVDTDTDNIDFVIADPTPGSEYLYTEIEPEEEEILDIGVARELENGEDVTIEGTVTALPGVLSTQYFYIQDATGGIQIYCYGKNFPSMTIGDFISATGVLSESNNERRINIKTADNIIILNHTDPVVPEDITISEIGEDQEGEYIKTVGIVTKTSGDTFYISDGVKEIKVVIKSTTGIDKPKMRKGDQVEVMGIVSQYKDEYRILPIDQDDVKIVASKDMLPRAGNELYIYLFISLFSTLLWITYLKARKKPAT